MGILPMHGLEARVTNPMPTLGRDARATNRQAARMRTRTREPSAWSCWRRSALIRYRRRRRLNGYELIDKVICGVRFADGIELKHAA
jgi:hypothetical protein